MYAIRSYYETTDPATNALVGSPNTPVTLEPGVPQTFLIALTPTEPMNPTDLVFAFSCRDVLV